MDREEELYLITVEAWGKTKVIEVTVNDLVDFTDKKGWTYGLDDCGNIILEPSTFNRGPEVADLHEWIDYFIDPKDLKEFTRSLHAYKEMKPKTDISKLRAAAYMNAQKGSAFVPRSNKLGTPSWWAYDSNAQWLMVDGAKVELTIQELEAFVASHHDLRDRDEKGYYADHWSRRKNTTIRHYHNIADLAFHISEEYWWKYSQTLSAKLETA